MKKEFTPRRKMLTSLVLLLLAITVAVGGTIAIYTSQVFQRSVVRNRDTEAIRFSSDKLYRVANTNQILKKYYYPMSQGQKTMSFTVCNFDQSNNTAVNQQMLEYDIKFEVSNGTDDFQYDVNGSKVSNGGTLNLSGSLSGGRRSTDTYTVSFSQDDYNKVKITVIVTPKDSSLTKNTVLQATLIPIEYATTQGVSLDWEYTDGIKYKVDEVDAYNVAISISGGEDEVVITWENDKLDIDPFFKEEIVTSGGTFTSSGNTSTLSFHMNSEDDTGTYQLRFYKHGIDSYGWSDWTDLPIKFYNKKSLLIATN